MKLWVFSDLHLEFGDWQRPHPVPEADVCVVAGDLMQGPLSAVRWLDRWVGHGMPCVFVLGNHEFYGQSVLEGTEWAKDHAAQSRGVRLLQDSSVVLGGVRFLGSTLWTDYALDGDADYSMAMAAMQVADHRRIQWRTLPQEEPWTPLRALEAHRRSRDWLERELAKPFDGPTVVVTHHAPHPLSVAPRFAGSGVNGAFVSDLSGLMADGPDLWVHGHVHDSFDYRVGRTRVLANPKGYESENGRFDPGLVVEV